VHIVNNLFFLCLLACLAYTFSLLISVQFLLYFCLCFYLHFDFFLANSIDSIGFSWCTKLQAF
jgi:hypothetical protein